MTLHRKLLSMALIGLIMLGLSIGASAEDEKSLLVLYKSSENDTAEQNIFAYHLQAFAEEQGYAIAYHDIEASLPSDKEMQEVQAIVTVFNGSIMKNARAYIDWLSEQILSRKKVLVLGNFGAFSPDGKEWFDNAALNRVYHLMGLEFVGNWTDDPKLIRIAAKEPDMVEFEAELDPTGLTHYFTIHSLNPDNEVFLTLTRTDLDDSDSAVIVKTPVAGLAIENYVFTPGEEGEAKKLLDLETFFKTCLSGPIPEGAVPDKRILALYKTTEDASPGKTLVARFLTKDLLALGYWPDYYAIDDADLPDEQAMERYQAVLSWFRTSDMEDSETYSDWLLAQIQAGRKAVILGNFGAFGQSQGDDKPLEQNPGLNRFFTEFGLEYKGNWTGDAKLLELTRKVSAMVEDEATLNPDDLRHYYEWESVNDDNMVYLEVRRTDLPDSESAFIVRTPFGGFAFEGYLYKSDPRTLDVSFLLNRRQFLNTCLEN